MSLILKDLYDKPINRAVNPAVSATKFDPETERIEIQEYVFTDEIMNGLFRILNAIKNNEPYDHIGIWIDGYYGSGKSHFLKYLDYCITPRTQEAALNRFLQAVKAIDPFTDQQHNLSFGFEELQSIANWLKKATIDTCIFNLETSYDNAIEKKRAFLHIFWNEFNGKRGFNKFNITLAQHLEKPLAEKGVFEAFKERIAEEGGNWDDPGEAADMIDNELGMVLDIAKELAPTLDKESIRERIIKRDTNMSIDRFGIELAAYLKDKGEDYRLILLADEVSQFINKERDRYLNLQEIITKLSEACDNKVWVACTAQQDLSEIMDDCHIAEEKDKEGKIKGRFEVKVSLKGTQPEVITQKRILDKKEEVKEVLGDLYAEKSPAFDLQFKLPNSYSAYSSKDDFVAYYPFVPYQFKLIMQVFNSFLNLGYVAKEVKGNERSIIKVIHSTAKKNAEARLGKFVSFDELYNNMFEEGLQARGQKAVDNAIRMARTYRDPKFAERIANVLFMICNISDTDKLVFPATIDNITSLLINDVETPRLNIKNEVGKVLEFLCDNNIIRLEPGKNGAPDIYSFYSEEEMKVASLIKSQPVDNNTQAERLKDIFFKYIAALKNKEIYATRSFAIGASIKQRSFLSNNADVVVEFMMDCDYDNAETLALHNQQNRMVYYVGQLFRENKRLQNALHWYCQVNNYMATPAPNEDNANTRKEFAKRAEELLEMQLAPAFRKILDTCPIISGVSVMDEMELGSKTGSDRYRAAIEKHLSNIYTKARLVMRSDVATTTDSLKKAMLRPVHTGDYDGLNAELTPAEHEVEIYLNKQYADVNVADILNKFSKAPYGWDNICTLYVINELVRRHRRDYSYTNNPNVEIATVASRIVSESSKFTIREAKAISQELIANFTNVWKDIFGMGAAFSTNDSTQIFRICRDENSNDSLFNKRAAYRGTIEKYGRYPFITPVNEAIDLFDNWLEVRDTQKFFEIVIKQHDEARRLMDTCKEVNRFLHDQMDNYRSIVSFARENNENFMTLDQTEFAEPIKAVSEFESMEWPIKIREFIKAKNMISAALEEKRRLLRDQITKAYNETFDQLEQSAEAQGVDKSVLSDRGVTIQLKTKSNSLSILQNNLNTDALYAEQIGRINAEVKRKQSAESAKKGEYVDTGNTGKGNIVVSEPKYANLTLRTRTITPLNNEQDVDAYLEKLKKQLMNEISQGFVVNIVK